METLKEIQKRVGVNPDGIFGAETAAAVGKFLKLSIFEASHFLGQVWVETDGFKDFEEKLSNYSYERAVAVFRNFRDMDEEFFDKYYKGSGESIANRAYANRFGNGSESSGDGWRFRGRGPFHTTFHSAYLELSKGIKAPEIMENPDLVIGKYALESARFYWGRRVKNRVRVWNLTDELCDEITTYINGPARMKKEERRQRTREVFVLLSREDVNY